MAAKIKLEFSKQKLQRIDEMKHEAETIKVILCLIQSLFVLDRNYDTKQSVPNDIKQEKNN